MKKKSTEEYSEKLVSFVESLFRQRATGFAKGSEVQFLEKHYLCGTMMPGHGWHSAATLSGAADQLFKMFRGEYIGLCKQLLGRRFTSPTNRLRQPFAVAFLDLEGASRSPVIFDSSSNPHIHFALLLHPDTLTAFEGVRAKGKLTHRGSTSLLAANPKVAILDVEPYVLDTADPKAWLGYSAKTAIHPAYQKHDLYRVYPEDVNLRDFMRSPGAR